jgi:hypothetical protein
MPHLARIKLPSPRSVVDLFKLCKVCADGALCSCLSSDSQLTPKGVPSTPGLMPFKHFSLAQSRRLQVWLRS